MPQADPEVGATLQKPSTQCLHHDFQFEGEIAKVGKQENIMSPDEVLNPYYLFWSFKLVVGNKP